MHKIITCKSAQPSSIENITPNYASQIYTDYNTRNPLQFHSQKIREFSTSTPAPYQPTHFQPTPAAPSQPAVTANYNPAANSIQPPFTAAPRQPAVSVIHATTPGGYQMDDMALGYFDSQITQELILSVKFYYIK